MLPKVSVHRFSCAPFTNVENYRRLVGGDVIDEIEALAHALKGARVCHINSTGFGGGVAELLARLVPLARALGINADWRLIQGSPEFFRVTKAFHNALQGSAYSLSESDKSIYLQVNRESARLLDDSYDVFVVHDPQPAAFRAAVGERGAKWIWRCHIDTSEPNREVAAFLLPFLELHDVAVFTMREFALPGLDARRTAFIAPAIDPLSTKNMELPDALCLEVIANAGLDTRRPRVVQVSRFDPWKDPLGVIDAYRTARREVPGLQLSLVGSIAGDDPEGWQLLARVQEETAGDDDIYVFTNLAGVGSMEVNAFQRAADVVIQKSVREGFGLVVSEAFWKGKPLVAGRAGGIPMQFPEGHERYLISSNEELAARVVELIGDPAQRKAFGAAAREHVRERFLLPRLLRDELRLIHSVLTGGERRAPPPAAPGAPPKR
ncbi:glycosyltransferase [Myxococcus stipitatus]|uniref:glycosyltransferase n=1 Tax=Myxococcus stipitatus TaxID=83455 RepID=UPI0030D212D9